MGEKDDPRLTYVLDDFDLSLSFHPQDFIQSNHRVNQAMVAQALELMSPQAHEHIVDLFCGIGNFSLPLAKKAKYVTGIEGVDAMVIRARDNAAQNRLCNTHFSVADLTNEEIVSSFIGRHFDNALIDGLLLDPPRSGAKEVCQKMTELSPKRIVYVSCDSATFARDTKLLVDSGYRLSRLGVVDMFPQTPHIEVMGLFIL